MPRKPTGMPPGRPPKAVAALAADKRKQKAMREALNLFGELGVDLSTSQKDRLLANAKAQAEDHANWKDVAFPAHAMVPFTDLQPLSEDELAKIGERTRGLLGAIVAGFTPKIPDLLNNLATDSPEKALKMYVELQEFLTPKLSRTETTGTVNHQATFVAVEARDADPRTRQALPGPEQKNEPEVVDGIVVTADRDERETGPGQPASTERPSVNKN